MLYKNMQQVWHSLEMLRLSPGCLAPTRATTSAFHLSCPPYTMAHMVTILIAAPVRVVSTAF
jgi:hypothetical protein